MDRRTWLASVGATLFVARLRDEAGSQPRAPWLADRDTLPIAVALQWTTETVANALATQPASKHLIANDAVTGFTIRGTNGPDAVSLEHDLYDTASRTYTTAPVAAHDLERLLDPATDVTFTIDLSFTLTSFFDVLLEQMTRTDDDLHNLAKPNDSAAILRTVEHEERDGKVDVQYESATHSIQGVPCTLVDIQVTPAVTLVFELDVLGRDAMRRLIAMDWSALARAGSTTTPIPPQVEVWRDNVLVFLANQTDMARAERFRTTIAERHADKPAKRLADDVRKDIDAHIITANHWGQTRESFKTEPHQAVMSDVLETIHQSAWLASPLCMSRELARIYGLSLDQKAAMTLQYGMGYCGEHSRTSFSILRTIMESPETELESIVLCGNANIDHGFVLCNLQVTHVLFTTATSGANTRVSVGQDIKVFNLRDALGGRTGEDVYVVDPYLDRSMMSPTADGLLRSLNSKRKQGRGKDTDFLVYQMQHPMPAGFAIEDIRERPIVERMERVKNV